MHDILRNRFQGAFIGAYWGEVIATTRIPTHPAEDLQDQFDQQSDRQFDQQSRPWFDRFKQHLAQFSPVQSVHAQMTQKDSIAPPESAALILVDSLPIALFYHDQPQYLRQIMQTPLQHVETTEAELTIVIGQLISLILRERFRTFQAVDWLSEVLKTAELSPQSQLAAALHQLQAWADRSVSLPVVTARSAELCSESTGSQSILSAALLALYSFLMTPDSIQLALWRWRRLPQPHPIGGLVLGLLAGLQQGLLGIPLAWQINFLQSSVSTGMTDSIGPILPMPILPFAPIDRLLALWSGIDPIDQLDANLWRETFPITAPPRVIRSPA
ncbi:MAG: ADP-ribosylglycohydrolase family protein [Elainella sp. Prado103]|jgi:hypothetical protein|nr:ADP-ribosylglycohydrolase family protein [Elainella sp. Prado103]